MLQKENRAALHVIQKQVQVQVHKCLAACVCAAGLQTYAHALRVHRAGAKAACVISCCSSTLAALLLQASWHQGHSIACLRLSPAQ